MFLIHIEINMSGRSGLVWALHTCKMLGCPLAARCRGPHMGVQIFRFVENVLFCEISVKAYSFVSVGGVHGTHWWTTEVYAHLVLANLTY